MLARLRKLAEQHPTLSGHLIDASEGMPLSASYRTRFGSLLEAYRQAGYAPDRDFSFVEINRRLRSTHPTLLTDLIGRLNDIGATVSQDVTSGLLTINGEFSAVLVLSRCRQTTAGSLRWQIQFNQRFVPDITILVRMDAANERPADYYLLPVMDIQMPKLLLCETNGAFLDTYQFDTLDYFTELTHRRRIEVAA